MLLRIGIILLVSYSALASQITCHGGNDIDGVLYPHFKAATADFKTFTNIERSINTKGMTMAAEKSQEAEVSRDNNLVLRLRDYYCETLTVIPLKAKALLVFNVRMTLYCPGMEPSVSVLRCQQK